MSRTWQLAVSKICQPDHRSMNHFSSCASETHLGGHLGNSMFSPPQANAISVTNNSLPFDHYAHPYALYHPNHSVMSCSTPASYISSNGPVQYGTQSSSSSTSSSSYGNQYFGTNEYSSPSSHTSYAPPSTANSMDYFARAKSVCSSVEYPNLFASTRKFSIDLNNNNNCNNFISNSRDSHDTSDVKREQSEELNYPKVENTANQIDDLEPSALSDGDYDDEDDDPILSTASNLRTPIYISPNCILYSYVGIDTIGAINDHFQRSFALFFQNMRSSAVNVGTGTGYHSSPASFDWNASGTPIEDSTVANETKIKSYSWQQSYYKGWFLGSGELINA